MVRHAFGFDCGCAGCEDCAWEAEELGQDIECGECGHLVLATAVAESGEVA